MSSAPSTSTFDELQRDEGLLFCENTSTQSVNTSTLVTTTFSSPSNDRIEHIEEAELEESLPKLQSVNSSQ